MSTQAFNGIPEILRSLGCKVTEPVKVKSFFLRRIQAHYRLDEIVKGKYWSDGKGCAVGCLVHSSNLQTLVDTFGMPLQMAHLIDRLFESLPNGEAKSFPVRFVKATQPHTDLQLVLDRWYLALLSDPKMGAIAFADGIVRPAIQTVIDLYAEKVGGKNPPTAAWDAAREAAGDVAWDAAWAAARAAAGAASRAAAGAAAWAAARDAAREAARAASGAAAWAAARDAAGDASRSAAWAASRAASGDAAWATAGAAAWDAAGAAAWDAAWDASRAAARDADAHYIWQANILLTLLAAAPRVTA
jgi:hypothetical protein